MHCPCFQINLYVKSSLLVPPSDLLVKVSIQQVIITFTADTSGDSPCSSHVLTMIPGCTGAIRPVPENNAAVQWWRWGGRAHLWINSYLCVDHRRAELISQSGWINVCIAPFKISDSTHSNVKIVFHSTYRRLHKVKYYYKLQTIYIQKKKILQVIFKHI